MNLVELVNSRLDYDPSTGVFTWKPNPEFNRTWNSKHAGKRAGSLNIEGYRYIGINYVLYRASRLAWLICNGEIPGDLEIDHINRVRDDDRIENLRLADRFLNVNNVSRKSKSGFKYVSKTRNKYQVRITVGLNHQIKLGHFYTIEEAVEARDIYLAENNLLHLMDTV